MWSPPELLWITAVLTDPVGTARIAEALAGALPADPQRPPDLRPTGPVDPQVRDRHLDLRIEPVDHPPGLRTRPGKLTQVSKRVRHPRRSPPGGLAVPHAVDDAIARLRAYGGTRSDADPEGRAR